MKLMIAARAITNLMHSICSTSYDITRLPPIVSPPRRRTVHVGNLQSCWGRAASILVCHKDFLKHTVFTFRYRFDSTRLKSAGDIKERLWLSTSKFSLLSTNEPNPKAHAT
ncbi:hypothetical protein AG1IA_02822 [Rhizoctonia solani AG-1 IA]|uniref:Uncharacterized protein n=1 Tax=Thanatephorus cucumeris (strain AG1-IA) TaxID=983506 RepID=L8X3D3_THACA|nr:hypothetical protein AG1IA_02822 [Rhizoctonia solani AG-1 IA]